MHDNRRIAVLAVASATALWLQAGAAAQAGTYPMRACNVPGQAAAGTGPWAWQNVATSTAFNGCAGGGPFGIAFPAASHRMEPSSAAGLTLTRPGEGARSAIGIRQVRLWMEARLQGSGSALFVQARGLSGSSLQQTDIYGPPGGAHMGEPWSSPLYAEDTQAFHLILLCSTSAAQPCSPDDPTPLRIQGAEVTLQEGRAPQASIVGGPLTSATRHTGTETLSYQATDGESGLARVEALIGGQVAGVHDFTATARCRYADWNACDPAANAELAVDTRSVADGTHTLQLRAVDAAGNQRTVQADQPVIVTNGAPPADRGAANGSAATDDARLTVGFARRRGTQLTKGWASKATMRGRLTTAGAPISGARIDVSATPASSGARKIVRRPVRTSPTGRFTYVSPPHTSSRRIRFEYRSHLTDSTPAAARDLRLRVRAGLSLSVSMHGVQVRYAGRLSSRPLPHKRLRIQMQGRAVGGRWQPFAKPRVSRTGRFRGRYRLRAYRPGVRLQFRAFVPRRRDYPFEATAGRSVTRRVR